MGFRLLVLFIFFFDHLAMVDLEFFLVRLVRLVGYHGLALRGHIEDLKHGIIVEML